MTLSSNTVRGHISDSGSGIYHFLGRLRGLSNQSLHSNISLIASIPSRIVNRLYYSQVFGSFGRHSLIRKPLLIQNPQFIHIGSNVSIRNGVRMQALQTNTERIPLLSIGDGTCIEQFAHIICHNRVIIGSNVAIAPMCGIVDTTHPWMESAENTNPGAQLLDDDGFVEIGEGTFIGMGTLILPNVRIGKRCSIGANSVVKSNIPDYSIAVGSPARVVRTHRPSTADI
jgi:acetyltransferase-like isoleucine patch superfamily enzyme